MNTQYRKNLDYTLGGTLIFLLKFPTILLGKLIKRNHEIKVGSRLLIIKMLGGGSLIIAQPALYAIRQKYPNTRLILLTLPGTVPFAKCMHLFDEIQTIDESSIINFIVSSLKALQKLFLVDTVVDLEVYSRLSTVFSLLTCARNRVGFYLETHFWRKGISTHLLFFNRFSGSYLFYDQVAILLGAGVPDYMLSGKHFINSNIHCEPVKNIRPKLVIAGCCSDMGKERMLSPIQWQEIVHYFAAAEKFGGITLLGSPADYNFSEQIKEALTNYFSKVNFSPAIENKCGKLSFAEAIREIASSQEFWTIDSGLLHIARLLRKNCKSWWGPTDPATRLRPMKDLTEKVYYKKIACSPCIHVTEAPPCNGKNLCMYQKWDEPDAEVLYSNQLVALK